MHARLVISLLARAPLAVAGLWVMLIAVLKTIQQKSFQPFFTPKPTGEGTGLGLSLSYDIITKSHGGTFTLASEDGEFAELTLTLLVAGQAASGILNCTAKIHYLNVV